MPWNPELRSVPRSVSSPEPGRRRWRGVAGRSCLLALFAAACSHANSVRLQGPSPDDEIYRVTCKDTIAPCREEANEVCRGHYQVLESTGAPVEPPRVTSAPGPASTGPRYQRVKWVGEMVIACGDAPRALAGDDAPAADAQPALAGSARPSPAPPPGDRWCVPGVTQECLGPAACRGAQACLPEGSGYGPCDCGNASTGVPSGQDAGASPAR
jgi:hypothetical protein